MAHVFADFLEGAVHFLRCCREGAFEFQADLVESIMQFIWRIAGVGGFAFLGFGAALGAEVGFVVDFCSTI